MFLLLAVLAAAVAVGMWLFARNYRRHRRRIDAKESLRHARTSTDTVVVSALDGQDPRLSSLDPETRKKIAVRSVDGGFVRLPWRTRDHRPCVAWVQQVGGRGRPEVRVAFLR